MTADEVAEKYKLNGKDAKFLISFLAEMDRPSPASLTAEKVHKMFTDWCDGELPGKWAKVQKEDLATLCKEVVKTMRTEKKSGAVRSASFLDSVKDAWSNAKDRANWLMSDNPGPDFETWKEYYGTQPDEKKQKAKPKSDSESSYEDYVERKKSEGEKPSLDKGEWEARYRKASAKRVASRFLR